MQFKPFRGFNLEFSCQFGEFSFHLFTHNQMIWVILPTSFFFARFSFVINKKNLPLIYLWLERVRTLKCRYSSLITFDWFCALDIPEMIVQSSLFVFFITSYLLMNIDRFRILIYLKTNFISNLWYQMCLFLW